MSAGHNVEALGPVHAIPTFYKAGAGERTAPWGTRERPLPLIIDSDPGLDDALAIGLAAASPELDLLAVTTVGGNADVTRCTENALRLLHAYGRDDVPVAEGAAGALLGSVVRATEVHGESGIGDTELPPAVNTRRAGGGRRADRAAARGEPGPGRDRADRAAHERGAPAPAVPAPGAEDRPPVPDGRLDRGGEHHGLGRVQHRRGPRGGRRRVPVRRADHDDRAGRDPPGAAGPGRCPRAPRARQPQRPDRRGPHRLRARPQPGVVGLDHHGHPRRRGDRPSHGPGPGRGRRVPRRGRHDRRPGPRPHDLRRRSRTASGATAGRRTRTSGS